MTRRFVLALLGGLASAAARLAGARSRRIRVLILDGYSNHDWQLTTALVRGMLAPTGLFTVDVATAPPTADAPGWDTWRPRFADYDVLIQTCNDLNGGPSWPQPVRDAFEAYVRNGGGVYVWHGGNNAFPDWPAYNEMIGLGWRKKDFGWAIAIEEDGTLRRIPAGEGPDTGHGARVDTVVRRLGDQPIHAGLPRAWLTPDIEVYHYARGPALRLEVLSYGFDPKTDMRWPLEWTTTFGGGRVYTSTFDHALFYQPPRMVLYASWLEDSPASFEVQLPAAVLRSERPTDEALVRRTLLASALTEGVSMLHAAGVAASVTMNGFAETQRQLDELRLIMPIPLREYGTAGADRIAERGGAFELTTYDDSTFG